MRKSKNLTKRLVSMVMIAAVVFVFSFTASIDNSYAASKTKYYYLPTSVESSVPYGGQQYDFGMTNIKYDKYGNIKYGVFRSSHKPIKFKIKYRNKKGSIKSVSYTGYIAGKKTYDKKGRLTTQKFTKGGFEDTYKFKTNKKGTINKVTTTTPQSSDWTNVKSIKYYKNGFVKKVVYSDGHVVNYSSNGLLTSSIPNPTDGSTKLTYKHIKKNGKVVRVDMYRNGKKCGSTVLKYGKAKTKDVWKYSAAVSYAGGPTNACELYSKSAQSGIGL